MQGKKEYQEKLFANFQLSNRVPPQNFYRRLKEVLDFHFLYVLTRPYYGDSGQKSIDPIVFFKICLVGYLENIISDRQLINHCSMRLDILYFLNYDIDEPLPWHSTISRTRQLYPEKVFEEVFTKVLTMCVEKGMVSGHTQAIDSAPIKANASMDTLELKVPEEELDGYLLKVRHISQMDKESMGRKAKENKASKEQRSITAKPSELQAIKSRNKKWSKDQNHRAGAKSKNSKYTSNKTHYSPTDPDARISVKPGKARKLNYMSQLSVDTGHHVITDIKAYHADKKDSQCMQDITIRLKNRLHKQGLFWQTLLADTGYSDGRNYAFLEQIGLTSYIPPHGTYKGGPQGFTLVKNDTSNYWICPQGKQVTFRKQFRDSRTGTLKDLYLTTIKDCNGCPIAKTCIKKSKERRITITAYREEYERNNKRIHSKGGRYMKRKRSSTVEPVFGTLTQFMGLRKINTIGIQQANKVMQLAAIAYNIKKYLKFINKTVQTNKQRLAFYLNHLKEVILVQISVFKQLENITNLVFVK